MTPTHKPEDGDRAPIGNGGEESASVAGMLSDDDVQWEISAASKNPAWLDMEYGRRIEALVRTRAALKP